jgi:uncharacterized protein YegL
MSLYTVKILFTAIIAVAGFGLCEATSDGQFVQMERKPNCVGPPEGSVYYVNHAPTSWDAAKAKCERDLNGSLIAFDTPGERLCLNDQDGDTYWTSGMYSIDSWNWLIGKYLYPIPGPQVEGIPWGSGHPVSPPNAMLCIAYTRINYFNIYVTTDPKGNLHKAICEVNPNPIAVPCLKLNDLAIVLDASGSIGSANFEIAKHFVSKLASAFKKFDKSRLTFVIYSSTSRIEIPLNTNLTPAEINAAILAARYDGGGTATDQGITAAALELLQNSQGAPKSLVVLTDGLSNSPVATEAAAKSANDNGIRTFSVGITSGVNERELLAIAGGNQAHVFTPKTFDELIHIIAPLSAIICPD